MTKRRSKEKVTAYVNKMNLIALKTRMFLVLFWRLYVTSFLIPSAASTFSTPSVFLVLPVLAFFPFLLVLLTCCFLRSSLLACVCVCVSLSASSPYTHSFNFTPLLRLFFPSFVSSLSILLCVPITKSRQFVPSLLLSLHFTPHGFSSSSFFSSFSFTTTS